MAKRKIYIAGPMRGYAEHNFPRFFQVEAVLRQEYPDFEIINPARMDSEGGVVVGETPSPDVIGEVLIRDLTHIATLREHDMLVLLPGWEKSSGVRAELALAAAVGKPGLYHFVETETDYRMYRTCHIVKPVSLLRNEAECVILSMKPPVIKPNESYLSVKESAVSKLSTDAQERKGTPIATGVLDYFPDAIAAVAKVSRIGNEQHNPGSPLHWDRTKSTDHADALLRHLIERGTEDSDGQLHSAKVAWRALALLQTEIENRRKERTA